MISFFPACIALSIALVVVFTELIKRLDRKDRLKGCRVYPPPAFSPGAAALLRIGNFFVPEQMWFWRAVIFAFSVFAFEAVLKRITVSPEKRDGISF